MAEGGFFEQKRASPAGLAVVVALHAGVLGALVMMKGPIFVRPEPTITEIYNVPREADPPPIPEPPPTPERPIPQTRDTVFDAPDRVIRQPTESSHVSEWRPPPPPPGVGETAVGPTSTGTVTLPPPPPVRREAEWDPRYAGDVQPPYPPSEERAQREGQVRVRVTIGPDGRVRQAVRLSATSDAFWRVTERHALSKWRFRPATVDGRPVESRKELSLTFRIEDR